MAERTISVRLKANADAYVKAMDEARASTKKLESESSANMARLGSTFQNVGKKMTVGVTLPLVGVAAAAVRTASSFESTFSQMVGLAGVAADEVDGLKASVLELSGRTAVAPQELAEALYFAASAGLSTSQAMDAVTIAAKASAAGLGSTQDVVGLVASAVASYGEENINAAQATDILTAAIREGRAEPTELASTLGRVLPIASQLGVSFGEVGGTVAYLSNVFGDTNRTVTATQGVFLKMLSPTQQGRDALEAMGTSAEELQSAIDSDGLMGALELLRKRGFADNAQALRALFDDTEAYQGAVALLSADQATLTGIMEKTTNAAGATEEAFAALDPEVQGIKQGWVDLQIALIKVGDVLVPIAADMASGIGDMANAFSDLDPTLQKVVIGLAAGAAAAGPLLIVTGSLIKSYMTLSGAMASSNTTMGTSAKAMGKMAVQAALMYAAFEVGRGVMKGLQGDTEWIYEDSGGLQGVMQDIGRMSFELTGGTKSAAAAWNEFEKEANAAFGTVTAGVYTMGQLSEALDGTTLSQEAQNLITIEFRKQLDAQEKAEQNLIEATEQKTSATDDATAATEEGTDATAAATDAIVGQISAAKIIQNEIDLAGSNVRRFGADGVENMRNVDSAADDAAAEIEALTRQFDDLRNVISDRSAYLSLEDQFDSVSEAGTAAFDAAAEGAEDAEGKARDYEQSVLSLKGQVIDYAEEVGDIPAEQVTDIQALIDQGRLDQARAALADLERTRQVRLNVVSYYSSVGSQAAAYQPNRGGARAHGGATYGGYMHEVNENGSELLTEGGKTYLMAARDGYVTPLSTAGVGSSSVSTVGDSYDIKVNNNRRDFTPDDMARALRQARFAA